MREMLIIGGSGFVASEMATVSSPSGMRLVVSSKSELDITNLDSICEPIRNADVVVNFAAYTDVKEATLDVNGPAWKLNVIGAMNVVKACKEAGKFLIHISTDGVFPITNHVKSPHTENEKLEDNPSLVSVYGYTKLKGEIEIIKSGAKTAILRIAYPFGNAEFSNKDYITKLIQTIKLGYPLFDDQWFTPTYIKSLPIVIEALAKRGLPGVFHWVCKDLVTPYKVGVFVNEKLNLKLEVKKGSLEEFEKLKGKQTYARFGGLSTEITQNLLSMEPPTWQEALEDFFEKDRGKLTNGK